MRRPSTVDERAGSPGATVASGTSPCLPGRNQDRLHDARARARRTASPPRASGSWRPPAAAHDGSRTAGPITTRPGQTTAGRFSSRAFARAETLMMFRRTKSTPSTSRIRRSRRWCRPTSATGKAPLGRTSTPWPGRKPHYLPELGRNASETTVALAPRSLDGHGRVVGVLPWLVLLYFVWGSSHLARRPSHRVLRGVHRRARGEASSSHSIDGSRRRRSKCHRRAVVVSERSPAPPLSETVTSGSSIRTARPAAVSQRSGTWEESPVWLRPGRR